MSKKIYEVYGTYGMYSDRVEYAVCAVTDEFYAKSIAETLNAWSREFYDYYTHKWTEEYRYDEHGDYLHPKYNDAFLDEHQLLKYDPNFHTSDETSYFVKKVEFYTERDFFNETPN